MKITSTLLLFLFYGYAIALDFIESNAIKVKLGYPKEIQWVDGKLYFIPESSHDRLLSLSFDIKKVKKVKIIDELAESKNCHSRNAWYEQKREIATFILNPKKNIKKLEFRMTLPCFGSKGEGNYYFKFRVELETENKLFYKSKKIYFIPSTNGMFGDKY